MWSFNRRRDEGDIEKEEVSWVGPLSWPGFEEANGVDGIPRDIQGVYVFTFKYRDGYLLYSTGISKSIRKRFSSHTREYRKGNYNVLDVSSAERGERKEIWHGWGYAKQHQDEFIYNKELILSAVEDQLQSFRVFVAEIEDSRKRERIEAAIMQGIYTSKEHWSELSDRGMFLKGRCNSEMPINLVNICSNKIYGLPNAIEI